MTKFELIDRIDALRGYLDIVRVARDLAFDANDTDQTLRRIEMILSLVLEQTDKLTTLDDS